MSATFTLLTVPLYRTETDEILAASNAMLTMPPGGMSSALTTVVLSFSLSRSSPAFMVMELLLSTESSVPFI